MCYIFYKDFYSYLPFNLFHIASCYVQTSFYVNLYSITNCNSEAQWIVRQKCTKVLAFHDSHPIMFTRMIFENFTVFHANQELSMKQLI